MLTSDANIINLDMVVLWNVKSAENFLFNIRDPEGTLKKVAESAIREVVGQTRMFPIITKERAKVANKARQIMVDNLNQYDSGVNITQVLIQEAEVHPDVQDAFQDVQSARQDALNTENEAQAYREDILPKARGKASKILEEAKAYKKAQVEKASGEAERFDKIFAAYKEGETVTRTRMYLETMEEVLTNSSKIVLDQPGAEGKGQGVVPYLPLNEIRPASGQAKRNRTGN
jgi:membrane protease subunit HflK